MRKGFIKVLDPVNELIYGVNELSQGRFNVQLKVRGSFRNRIYYERFNQLAKQLFISGGTVNGDF